MVDQVLAILEAKDKDLAWIAGVIAVCVTTIIQKVSTKYKPWTWLAEQFGKAVNKEMLDKLDAVEKKVDSLEQADIKQKAESERKNAVDTRRRILRVADEIRAKYRHSEEFFNDALQDISFYRNYCRDHPEFENSKAIMSCKIIEDTYRKCLESNDFV